MSSFVEMERTKILFIAKNIPIPDRQSGNKIIYTIADNLKSSYEISFFFPKSRVPWGMHFLKKHRPLFKLKDWVYNSFEVFVIPFVQLPGLLTTYWFLNRIPKRAVRDFEKNKYNLIHAHYGMPDGYMAYLLSKKYKVPYVLTLRNHDVLHLNQLKTWNPDYRKYIKVLDGASEILVTNANLQEYFNEMGFASKIMPHGIDEKHFLKKEAKGVNDIIRISCVSNYIPTKNIEWVIDAILDYSGAKNIRLTVAGDMQHLPEYYKNIVNDRIVILGKQSHENVMELLESSDIFALPSEFETFGLVYLEAAAKRNAVVGFKAQGVWGVFEDKTEMLFAEDYQDFKRLLYKLIEEGEYRGNMQSNARKRAESMIWENVSCIYQKVYNNLLI